MPSRSKTSSKKKEIIIDLEKASPWNDSEKYFIHQEVFKRDTLDTERKKFDQRYMKLKYLENSEQSELTKYQRQRQEMLT